MRTHRSTQCEIARCGGFAYLKWLLALAVVVGAALEVRHLLFRKEAAHKAQHYHKATKADFRVTVKLTGELTSTKVTMLKSELEGVTTIKSVIEEGTAVKGNTQYIVKAGDTLESIAAEFGKELLNIKDLNEDYQHDWGNLPDGQQILIPGDLLVELDPLQLKERINSQEINVQRQENGLNRAIGNSDTLKLSAALALKVAENSHKQAIMDREKEINSTIKNTIKDYRGSITNLANKVSISKAKLEWYRKLEERNFLSKMALRDEEQKVAEYNHQIGMAQANLEAYLKYDKPSNLNRRELAVDESVVNIEKQKVKNAADLSDANSTVVTARKTLELELEKLADLREQMANTRIYAPEDGIVVYYAPRHWERQEPVADGSHVRRGQNLIKLPRDRSLKVELSVPQSMRAQLRRGMRAWVQLENSEPLPGTLSLLSNTVDSNRKGHTQRSTFKGEITLDQAEFPDSVSEGMSVKVEIHVIDLVGVNQRIKVPNQCVITRMIAKDTPQTGCWVLDPATQKHQWRPVTIEYIEDNFLAIKKETDPRRGLREGDLVHLSPLTQADALNLEEGVTGKGNVKLGTPGKEVPKEQSKAGKDKTS